MENVVSFIRTLVFDVFVLCNVFFAHTGVFCAVLALHNLAFSSTICSVSIFKKRGRNKVTNTRNKTDDTDTIERQTHVHTTNSQRVITILSLYLKAFGVERGWPKVPTSRLAPLGFHHLSATMLDESRVLQVIIYLPEQEGSW
jgi:hypothetical protein